MRKLLLATMLLAAPAVAQTGTPGPAIQPGETLLEVQAKGSLPAVPDVATFEVGVGSDGDSPSTALAANSRIGARLIAAAGGAGVTPVDLRTTDLAVRPRFRLDAEGDETKEIIGYRATNSLSVRIRDVRQASAVLTALVNAGATDIEGPRFTFSD